MKKRILSLLLCLVLCLSLMPMSAFAVERTIAPVTNSTNDVWLTADGKLHWTDTGSSSYTIKIFQHPGTVALETIPVGSGVTEYDLYAVMDSGKFEQRGYRIEISDHVHNLEVSKHEALIILYVSPYKKLSAPTNLRWNGNVAEWDVVSNANEYIVYLYDSAGTFKTVKTTENNSCDCSPYEPGNGWYFEVYACGTNYRDSEMSESPKYGSSYTLSFNMLGHGTQITAQTVESGIKATKPADPTAEGWTFDGWYADATFSAAFNFNTAITADTTVYAKWTEDITPSILWGDANGDGTVDSKDLSLLRKYMASYDYTTGTSTVAVQPGADANGDGTIDSKDLSLLRKYMAAYDYTTGTSTVVLGPSK